MLQAEIEAKFSELQSLATQRSSRLAESLRLFRFLRETDEVAEWMGDQTALAASEDYGRDVEHVELLIQTFDSFLSSLAASGGRVTSCLSTGRALIAEGNPECEQIQAKLDDTQQLWEDLRELAHARQEVCPTSAICHWGMLTPSLTTKIWKLVHHWLLHPNDISSYMSPWYFHFHVIIGYSFQWSFHIHVSPFLR